MDDARCSEREAPVDEPSYSDFHKACKRLAARAVAMSQADPDEMAEHYLPLMTREFAIIFAFVGANMTARHLPRYARTVAEYQTAKDVQVSPQSGTLPPEPHDRRE